MGQFFAIFLSVLASFGFVAQDGAVMPAGMAFDVDGVRLYSGPVDSMYPITSGGECIEVFAVLESNGGTWMGSYAALARFMICGEETVVHITGNCSSGCTLLLALDPAMVCVDPQSAVLNFHGPYSPYTIEEMLEIEGVEATDKNIEDRERSYHREQSAMRAVMRRTLPRWLDTWLDSTGAMELEGQNVVSLTGAEYNRMVPATACDPSLFEPEPDPWEEYERD